MIIMDVYLDYVIKNSKVRFWFEGSPTGNWIKYIVNLKILVEKQYTRTMTSLFEILYRLPKTLSLW